jgi:hypothetical protein
MIQLFVLLRYGKHTYVNTMRFPSASTHALVCTRAQALSRPPKRSTQEHSPKCVRVADAYSPTRPGGEAGCGGSAAGGLPQVESFPATEPPPPCPCPPPPPPPLDERVLLHVLAIEPRESVLPALPPSAPSLRRPTRSLLLPPPPPPPLPPPPLPPPLPLRDIMDASVLLLMVLYTRPPAPSLRPSYHELKYRGKCCELARIVTGLDSMPAPAFDFVTVLGMPPLRGDMAGDAKLWRVLPSCTHRLLPGGSQASAPMPLHGICGSRCGAMLVCYHMYACKTDLRTLQNRPA